MNNVFYNKNSYCFPAFFYFDDDGISIEFPDLPGCLSCAETEEEAFRNAKEALGLHLYGMEIDGDEIPAPTSVRDLRPGEGGVAVMVDVFMPPVRDRINRRAVKKTVTIPAWLNREAEAAGANFSLILQDALKSYLGKSAPQA
ncbi:MAG: type II toxin-antitoxin system HicB family antitoxin [Oscillibacter sp.]|nr:type II toxin-antitoxin system HicB family antitoxin [Oscillibacter sp.]